MKVDSDALLFLLLAAQKDPAQGASAGNHFDGLGVKVGRQMAALMLAEMPFAPQAHVDVAKWLGSQLWPRIFGRVVDTLRTDSRQTFLLVSRQSLVPKYQNPATHTAVADPVSAFAAEIVRGAIDALQLKAVVDIDPAVGAMVVQFI